MKMWNRTLMTCVRWEKGAVWENGSFAVMQLTVNGSYSMEDQFRMECMEWQNVTLVNPSMRRRRRKIEDSEMKESNSAVNRWSRALKTCVRWEKGAAWENVSFPGLEWTVNARYGRDDDFLLECVQYLHMTERVGNFIESVELLYNELTGKSGVSCLGFQMGNEYVGKDILKVWEMADIKKKHYIGETMGGRRGIQGVVCFYVRAGSDLCSAVIGMVFS